MFSPCLPGIPSSDLISPVIVTKSGLLKAHYFLSIGGNKQYKHYSLILIIPDLKPHVQALVSV